MNVRIIALAAAPVVFIGLGVSVAWASEPSAQLVASYDFDSTGGGVVPDLTGGGHDLTLSGTWSVDQGVAGTPAVYFHQPSIGTIDAQTGLDPGASSFAVTATFRMPEGLPGGTDTPNIVQKGLTDDPGQWKMQIKQTNGGQVQCRFKGQVNGSAVARILTSPVTGVADGGWHTATCWREGPYLGVTLDGTELRRKLDVGSIANTRSATVADKSTSAPTDQFIGVVDYVAFAVGSGAKDLTIAGAPIAP